MTIIILVVLGINAAYPIQIVSSKDI